MESICKNETISVKAKYYANIENFLKTVNHSC